MPGLFYLRLFLLGLAGLLVACNIAAFILDAINIRKMERARGRFSVIDPAFIVATILGFIWFAVVLLCNAKIAVIVSSLFSAWFLADAISYSVREFDSPERCGGPNPPSGCIEIYRSLLAFAWIDFGLSIIFIAFVCILANKHTNARTNVDGWKIPIWGLCRLRTPANNAPEKG